MEPVADGFFHPLHLQQLVAPLTQRRQCLRFGVGQRTQFGLQVTSELGYQPRIDGVGLGPFAARFGVMPDLSGVDYYYRQPGSRQLTDRQLFQFAACFQHHSTGRQRTQTSQELTKAVAIVADGKLLATRPNREVVARGNRGRCWRVVTTGYLAILVTLVPVAVF